MKVGNGGRVVHSLSEKRKVQPRCLQGEWVEEGVHMRKNNPQKRPELRNWRYQIPQKWDVRAMKALRPQVPIPSPCSQRVPLFPHLFRKPECLLEKLNPRCGDTSNRKVRVRYTLKIRKLSESLYPQRWEATFSFLRMPNLCLCHFQTRDWKVRRKWT